MTGLVCLYPQKGMSRPPILKPAWAPETAGPVLTRQREGAGAPAGSALLATRCHSRVQTSFPGGRREPADSAPTSPTPRRGPASSSHCPAALSLPDLHTADADLDFHLVALRKPHVGLTS